MGRSKRVPGVTRSAGVRLTVILKSGHFRCELMRAARTRLRISRELLSPRPTT